MNLMHKIFILFAFLTLACKNNEPQRQYSPERQELKKELVNVNRKLLEKDRTQIKAYIERRGWEMTESPTGLWYMFTLEGEGQKPVAENTVSVNYRVELLDGTYCYSSDSSGVKKFIVGKGRVERGLEELILRMHVGDKARAIMPPHLAHGLLGDEIRIPARSTIVYEVELINITGTN